MVTGGGVTQANGFKCYTKATNVAPASMAPPPTSPSRASLHLRRLGGLIYVGAAMHTVLLFYRRRTWTANMESTSMESTSMKSTTSPTLKFWATCCAPGGRPLQT